MTLDNPKYLDADVTLSADSDINGVTQKAAKDYVDSQLSGENIFDHSGDTVIFAGTSDGINIGSSFLNAGAITSGPVVSIGTSSLEEVTITQANITNATVSGTFNPQNGMTVGGTTWLPQAEITVLNATGTSTINNADVSTLDVSGITTLGTSTLMGQAIKADTFRKDMIIELVNSETAIAVGTSQINFTVPSSMNAWNLQDTHARVIVPGTGAGSTNIMMFNVTSSDDMLNAPLSVDPGETGSDTGTAFALGTTVIATNDLLRIEVDNISATPPKGLIVRFQFGEQ